MKKIIISLLFLFLNINVYASIVVMDADSGRVLFEKGKDEKKLIASTTKVMTSIIALENADLNKNIIVGDEIKKVNGSMLYIKEGEKFKLKDLLIGLMLQSGNDAAMTIATNTLGYNEFIAQMNIKAFKLGMYNTSYENPHGLNDDSENYSTAYDLSLLMKYAIKNKNYIEITTTQKYKTGNYIWYNKNKLLNEYKYLITGKIGYTKKSGQVYVSSAQKDGKTIVIASIDEPDKFNLHKTLYNKYFNSYKKYKIISKNNISFLINNSKNDYYYLFDDFYLLLKPEEIKKLKFKVKLSNYFNYIDIYVGNEFIKSIKLYKKENKHS